MKNRIQEQSTNDVNCGTTGLLVSQLALGTGNFNAEAYAGGNSCKALVASA